MAIPHPSITKIPNNEPDAVPALWNTRYVEIDENFSDLSAKQEALITEIVNSRSTYPTVNAHLSTLDSRMLSMESTIIGVDQHSIAYIKKANAIDWEYSADRINFEFFTPDYTMTSAINVPVLSGILGDDSLDVSSTYDLIAGQFHVLHDAYGAQLIHIKAILSGQRVRLYGNLTKNWGSDAHLSAHNISVIGINNAQANDGAIWLSNDINVGDRNGRVVIRRTDNAAQVKIFYLATDGGSWVEAVSRARPSDAAMPTGFIDYEYDILVPGHIRLRLDVIGVPVTIQHIVVFGLQYLYMIQQHIDDAERHHRASKLDWTYRFDRMNFEFFSPGYTLIDKLPVAIREVAVIGDNTIDVGDSSQFELGDYYVLSDLAHSKLIKIAGIHSDNIITIDGVLDRRWDVDSKVSKCNFSRNGVSTIGNNSQMWISKQVYSIGDFAVIRRTDNTALIRFWWLDSAHANWNEVVGTTRMVGSIENVDDVPVGFMDVSYALPMQGVGKIMLQIVDEPQMIAGVLTHNTRPIVISHIVTVSNNSTSSGATVTSASIATALGFTPVNTYTKAEVDAKATVTSARIATALGFTPLSVGSTYTKAEVDAKAFSATVTSASIVAALGFTPLSVGDISINGGSY